MACLLGSSLLRVGYAHPVAYEGATQLMVDGNASIQDFRLFHSFSYKQALGPRFVRLDDYGLTREIYTLQYNHLLKRWNEAEAQANVYLGIGAGFAEGSFSGKEPTGSLFLQGDYETRQFYSAYKFNLFHAEEFTHTSHVFQVGFSPYKAEYDQVSTWGLLQFKYVTEFFEEIEIMPMIRFFKGDKLFEIGVSTEGKLQLNFMLHF